MGRCEAFWCGEPGGTSGFCVKHWRKVPDEMRFGVWAYRRELRSGVPSPVARLAFWTVLRELLHSDGHETGTDASPHDSGTRWCNENIRMLRKYLDLRPGEPPPPVSIPRLSPGEPPPPRL